MDYNALYWLDDVISCLGILVGVGGAIFLFTRRKTVPAVLVLIGFLAMALHPILDIILYRLIDYYSSSLTSPLTLDFAYACIAGPGFFIGAILIVIAIVLSFRNPILPPIS